MKSSLANRGNKNQEYKNIFGSFSHFIEGTDVQK